MWFNELSLTWFHKNTDYRSPRIIYETYSIIGIPWYQTTIFYLLQMTCTSNIKWLIGFELLPKH